METPIETPKLVKKVNFLMDPGGILQYGEVLGYDSLIEPGTEFDDYDDQVDALIDEYEELLRLYVEKAKQIPEDEVMVVVLNKDRRQLKSEVQRKDKYLQATQEIKGILGDRCIVLLKDLASDDSNEDIYRKAEKIAQARGFIFGFDLESEVFGDTSEQAFMSARDLNNKVYKFTSPTVFNHRLTDKREIGSNGIIEMIQQYVGYIAKKVPARSNDFGRVAIPYYQEDSDKEPVTYIVMPPDFSNWPEQPGSAGPDLIEATLDWLYEIGDTFRNEKEHLGDMKEAEKKATVVAAGKYRELLQEMPPMAIYDILFHIRFFRLSNVTIELEQKVGELSKIVELRDECDVYVHVFNEIQEKFMADVKEFMIENKSKLETAPDMIPELLDQSIFGAIWMEIEMLKARITAMEEMIKDMHPLDMGTYIPSVTNNERWPSWTQKYDFEKNPIPDYN